MKSPAQPSEYGSGTAKETQGESETQSVQDKLKNSPGEVMESFCRAVITSDDFDEMLQEFRETLKGPMDQGLQAVNRRKGTE